MTSHLLACPSCARHVRTTEEACPFCAAPLSEAFRATPAPRPPIARLARAALVALGAGAVAGAAACGGETSLNPPADDGGAVDGGQSHPGSDGGQSRPDTGVVSVPPYGISPPPVDAGSEKDAGEDVVVVVPYGAPPPPPHDGG